MNKFSKVLLLLAPLVLSSCDFFKPVVARQLSISDEKAFDYHVGDVFDNFVDNGGLKVSFIMSDNSTVKAEKGSYTYEITEKNNSQNVIDSSKPFENAGNYVVTVSNKNLPSVVENIIVLDAEEEKTLSSISVSNYSSEVYQNETYKFDGVVTAHYSDNTTKNVTSGASIGTISTSTLGEKTLNISYTENSIKKSTSIKINVIEKPEIDISVTSVTVSPTSATLTVDETKTLTAKVLPTNATIKTLTWSSSDSTIASVSASGEVTALKTGTCTITATAKDGSGCKGTCKITVNAKTILVTSITLSNTTLNLTKGSTSTLTATVAPTDASNKNVTWSTTSSTIATVSTSGVVTAKKTGTATITATAKDGSGVKATCIVNVTTPVTGISLNKTTLSLNKGSSETLTATISPSDADNKNVTWSGSANGISVDSNGKVTVSSTASTGKTATIVATSNENSTIKASCTVTVANTPARDAWTLLIYMCGSNLESDRSQGGAATEDLSEIYELRSSLTDDVNIVVQAGGASSWKSTYSSVISKDKCNRFHLTKSGYVSDSQTSKVNMGLESSLESFVEWGLSTYPADKVGLVFWNHGGGMDGCCFDEQFSDDSLEPYEVASAIPDAISASNYNQNLEFIGYDCCLMSVQDIAGLNANYANYMIASEESEWGYGWTYNEWVDDLIAKKSTETILKACVDSFYSETEETYEYWGEDNDQTLAYYNLQNWNAYETAWENFASYLSSNVIKSSSNWNTFKNVINKAKKYGYDSGSYPYDLFDVKDALNKIKSDSNYKSNSTLVSKVSDVESAFTGLGVYSKCGSAAGNSNGLCMFCPISGYSTKTGTYAEDNTCFTAWRSLCITYGSWSSGGGWY